MSTHKWLDKDTVTRDETVPVTHSVERLKEALEKEKANVSDLEAKIAELEALADRPKE